MAQKRRIGELLVEAGLLKQKDVPAIDAHANATKTRFASAAVDLGLVSEQEVLQFLAKQHGVPAVDLTRSVLPRALLNRIPKEVASREEMIPLRLEDSNLLLAMSSPDNLGVRDEIAFVTGFSVLPYVAMRRRLLSAVEEAYADSSDPYLGPRASAEDADQYGYVAIVTGGSVSAEDEVAMEVEIEVDEAPDGDDTIELNEDAIVEPPASPQKEGYDHWVGEGADTVIVIDDEPEILKLLVTTLKSLDVNIVSSVRGVDALHKIKQYRPDLVITDAMLPEVHGFEIVRKLKESKRFAKTPVLMISAIYRGWRIAEDIKTTYQVDAFLEKPFRVAELRHHVSQLLETTERSDVTELPAEALRNYTQGVEAYKSGQLEEAFDKLKAAEAAEPFSSRVQFMLARVLERQERPLQAIYHYERAIELKPTMFAATKNLALLYQTKGFRNKAIEMWERSLRAAPSDDVREQIKSHLVSIL